MTTTRPAAETETRTRGLSPRVFYRTVSIAEAITWTLLIVGMLLKYAAGLGSLPVLIAGSLHGLVFITYAATSVLVGVNQRWRVPRIVLAVVMAIIPYATIPFDVRMDRTGALEGDWHREPTDDPRDQRWERRVLRWFLRRPAVLITVFVLAVLVIMTVLLVIGPPGGWS
jgi:integral membrane protein